ncbi:EAL domain-containing protein [Paenibacillus sediminis]|uniref:EAL domain-containing protein (Putative c-di-GMP-specific phosphodiesterase class I) n=1 Tax=Paenibacillus sediminis TaxID=664909 RepID=A0ABS4H328_9BACL|nr:EAL domain-containing protein [Paenibacillus sediminis]MBP1936943.1 EAL domain-containing protein (putative c-di-GMP-specific phosphodiesterase class I) [Paenibacillus sediminis]
MNFSGCKPIEDQGIVKLQPVSTLLIDALNEHGLSYIIQDDCVIHYSDSNEMMCLLQKLNSLPAELQQSIQIYIVGQRSEVNGPEWIPLKQLNRRLNDHHIMDIIKEEQFTSYMQPIVDSSEQIVAFEFLLRPAQDGVSFHPYELFEVAREAGLQSFLDRAAHISAIETSSLWVPQGIKRFVNFLPSSIYNPEYCLSYTFHTIERLKLDPRDFVFEVVETEQIDIQQLQYIFDLYRDNGIAVALDDVGAGYSTLEEMVLLRPDYVKIDRGLISECDKDPIKQREITKIVELANDFGGEVLAEGIERREEFEFCVESGIQLAQGYLFGKPSARPPKGVFAK